MRSAALHRKIRLTEDVLTATVFDLMRAHDRPDLVLTLLEEARVVGDDGLSTRESLANRLPPTNWDCYEIEFWPRWSVGEPDVVFRFLKAGKRIASVVVEVKAGASKSGSDHDDDAAFAPDPRSGDQLARYLGEAIKHATDEFVAVLYLTHHALPPREELAASRKALAIRAIERHPIAWLSWRDVEALLVSHAGNSDAFSRDVADAVEVLRMYGYCRFHGRWQRAESPFPKLPERIIWGSAQPNAIAAEVSRKGFSWGPYGRLNPVPNNAFWTPGQRSREWFGPHPGIAPAPARIFYSQTGSLHAERS